MVGYYAREAIHMRQHNSKGEIEWYSSCGQNPIGGNSIHLQRFPPGPSLPCLACLAPWKLSALAHFLFWGGQDGIFVGNRFVEIFQVIWCKRSLIHKLWNSWTMDLINRIWKLCYTCKAWQMLLLYFTSYDIGNIICPRYTGYFILKQARKSSEDAQATEYAQFKKVWAG